MVTVLHGYRGAGLCTASFCNPVCVGLGVCVVDVIVGAVVAAGERVVLTSVGLTPFTLAVVCFIIRFFFLTFTFFKGST